MARKAASGPLFPTQGSLLAGFLCRRQLRRPAAAGPWVPGFGALVRGSGVPVFGSVISGRGCRGARAGGRRVAWCRTRLLLLDSRVSNRGSGTARRVFSYGRIHVSGERRRGRSSPLLPMMTTRQPLLRQGMCSVQPVLHALRCLPLTAAAPCRSISCREDSDSSDHAGA